LRQIPSADMPSPLPRWDRWVGSLARRIFHPLLLPSDCGLPRFCGGSAPTLSVSRPARRSLALRPARSRSRYTTLSIRGSGGFVTSTAAPIATGWNDRGAGRELHPLRICAFPRRTQKNGIRASTRPERPSQSNRFLLERPGMAPMLAGGRQRNVRRARRSRCPSPGEPANAEMQHESAVSLGGILPDIRGGRSERMTRARVADQPGSEQGNDQLRHSESSRPQGRLRNGVNPVRPAIT
jgi:hypothetical protein